MAKNTEKGQIQTSAIASTYLQDSETLDQKADGLSPLLPAPSPVDQVCNCQPWLQLWKHRQGLDAPFSAVTLDICTLLCWPCIAERQGTGFHWKRNPVMELTVILLNLLCEGESQTANQVNVSWRCAEARVCVWRRRQREHLGGPQLWPASTAYTTPFNLPPHPMPTQVRSFLCSLNTPSHFMTSLYTTQEPLCQRIEYSSRCTFF